MSYTKQTLDSSTVIFRTFCISIMIHALVILTFNFKWFFPGKRLQPFFEITYNKPIKMSQKEKVRIARELMPAKEKGINPSLVAENPKSIQPFKAKTQPFRADFAKFYKPKDSIAYTKPQSAAKLIKVGQVDLSATIKQQSKDPAYQSYQEMVHKKLNGACNEAAQFYDYFENPSPGKIVAIFTIQSDGTLKDVTISEGQSSYDAQQQRIILTAFKKASPFNKFPSDLNYPDRTFSVEIVFEMLQP